MRGLLIAWNDSILAGADLWDWLDIGLLAVLIYGFLTLLKGTRALQSLIGLFLVLALYVLAEFFDLATLHWVLDHVFVYLVLALVILFQEDIRRVLARAGGTFFTRGSLQPSDSNVLEEVIKAVFALAHRRVGALIVLEREARLGVFSEGAHAVDGMVSTELLAAIFHPTSPLHDGALVIAKNRIVSAGVFLPLSVSKDIARTWGTRHRAALGISEQTDALCLVVSEERGTVALVVSGEIIPVADANDLRQRLAEASVRAGEETPAEAEAISAS